jgi:hypothetical protein
MFLYLVKHNYIKTYGGSGCIATPFLTSALDGGDWSASSTAAVLPGKEPPVLIG